MSASRRLDAIAALLDEAGVGQSHPFVPHGFDGMLVDEGCWRCGVTAATDVGLCQACADFLRSEKPDTEQWFDDDDGMIVRLFVGDPWQFGSASDVAAGYTAGGVDSVSIGWTSAGTFTHQVAPLYEQEWWARLTHEMSERLAAAAAALVEVIVPAVRAIQDSIGAVSELVRQAESPQPPPKVRQTAFLNELRERDRRRTMRRH